MPILFHISVSELERTHPSNRRSSGPERRPRNNSHQKDHPATRRTTGSYRKTISSQGSKGCSDYMGPIDLSCVRLARVSVLSCIFLPTQKVILEVSDARPQHPQTKKYQKTPEFRFAAWTRVPNSVGSRVPNSPRDPSNDSGAPRRRGSRHQTPRIRTLRLRCAMRRTEHCF